ncbi:MAG: primosomal protein N', partial [Candidatus Obscuribacterales bacterium]|nr:primosomal protein N' [Candidatus Obscuribacterales bacterium]
DAGTYFEAALAGRILELPQRVYNQALPSSILVDMRHEFLLGNKSIISQTLQEELSACLERKEQAILLINRRGYASHVFCRACGNVLRCKHCSVSLVFHSSGSSPEKIKEEGLARNGRLNCHHCGFQQSAVQNCPACQSPFLKQFGLGTQKVEEETLALFPEARILRLDSDISSRKGAYEEIFNKFANGDADILIGTQIVAKGLDIHRVTVVGVLAADAAFNLPDFRSLERGFQLLTQVSGRAGRGEFPGKVILQTYNTELPALLMAKNQDYASFVESELAARRDFDYPPFSRLLRILASGPDEEQVQSALERLAEELSNYLEEFDAIKILGPAPCLIERIKGQFRFHIIIKNLMGDSGQEAIASFFRSKPHFPGVRLTIDVDPMDLV